MKGVKDYLRDVNGMKKKKKTFIQLGFDVETLKQGFGRRWEAFKTNVHEMPFKKLIQKFLLVSHWLASHENFADISLVFRW